MAYGTPVVNPLNIDAAVNPPTTRGLTADGFTWADINAFVVDKNNNLIIKGQWNNSGANTNSLFFSNDGMTWTQNGINEAALTRASLAYDAANDILHSLDMAIDMTSSNGLIYRQWSITRSGNNIASLARVAGINLQMDFYNSTNVMTGDFPKMILMTDAAFGTFGALLAMWSVSGQTVAAYEYRASMVVLAGASNAGGTAGNWKSPTNAGASTTLGAGTQPQVAYAIIQGRAGAGNGIVGSFAFERKSSGSPSHPLDVYWFGYDVNGGANQRWVYRRLQYDGVNHDFRTGLTAAQVMDNNTVAGTDTGYAFKYQLITQISEDTVNNLIYVGFPVWLSNVLGDTQRVWSVGSNDVPALFATVASANGAHPYAPTMDLTVDSVTSNLIVTYDGGLTGGGILANRPFYIVYNTGGGIVSGPTLIWNGPADIPLLLTAINARYTPTGQTGAQLIGAFRDTFNTPTGLYRGYMYYIPITSGGQAFHSFGQFAGVA